MSAIVGIDAEIMYVSSTTLAAATLGAVIGITINAAGTLYALNDVITLTDGNNDCTITVDSVGGGGEVLTASITVPGTGYVEATGALGVAAPTTGDDLASFDLRVSNSLTVPVWTPGTKLWTLAVNNSAYSWVLMTERNEFNISISVDVAEHKAFVTNISEAWVDKARLYMDWSGSLSGYYDDADDAIFTTMKTGDVIHMLFVDTKEDVTKYWLGQALLTTVDHDVSNEDFATLDVDFEGNGVLYRSALPQA